jgi:hypothetical protein
MLRQLLLSKHFFTRINMVPTVEQMLKIARQINAPTKKGKASFMWLTEDAFNKVKDGFERAENDRRCSEIEEKLNRNLKSDQK